MVGDLANTEVKRGSGEVLMRTKTGELWSSVLLGPQSKGCRLLPLLHRTTPGPARQVQVKWAQDKREPAIPEQTLKKQLSVTGWSLIKTACSSAGILKERGFVYLVQLER